MTPCLLHSAEFDPILTLLICVLLHHAIILVSASLSASASVSVSATASAIVTTSWIHFSERKHVREPLKIHIF
jgi:hypothetical protein